MGTYNLTLFTNNTNPLQFVNAANDLTNNGLANIFLGVLFFIILASLKEYDTKTGFFVASAATSVLSMMFFFAGLIGSNVLILPMIALFASMIGLALGGD